MMPANGEAPSFGATGSHAPSDHERRLFAHIITTGLGFKLLTVFLVAVTAWGVSAWIWQLKNGLGVTGLNRPVFWGVYITNFVFFIGVSHAGTLVSAILRLTRAEWRRSLTRMAELITVLVLIFGVGSIIVDMGRPDRFYYVFLYPNFRSPLVWDVCSIGIYLVASTLYLFLPMLPDIARLERRVGGWRGRIYSVLRLGYSDTPRQRARLQKAIGVLMVLVIPIAVSVHTVVSWVFAMTIQPMWHSTIFGPYFVTGAIFSGIAAILTFMVILRKAFHLEAYLKPVHFDYLGKWLLVMALLWAYFTLAEHLTIFYGNRPHEMEVLDAKLRGEYALPFWGTIAACLVIPFVILCRRRSPLAVLIASISVNLGMYLERFTIVVPTLMNPRIDITGADYSPSWVEWSILAGCISAFVLLYLGFTKLFPIVSVWEVEEGVERGAREASQRISTYYPDWVDGEKTIVREDS